MLENLQSFWRWFQKPMHFFVLLLATLPFLILLGWMDGHARNIPRFDQYRAIPISLETADGELQFADLTQPTHGHITFFTFVITALNTKLTNGNLRVEAYSNILFATLNFCIYLLLFWQTQKRFMVLILLPFAMLVFSVQQDFNWAIAYDNAWHIGIFWYLLALVTLVYNSENWLSLVFAALFCIFATFSIGNGFLSWGGILLFLLISDRFRWRQVFVWLVFSVVVTVSFLYISLPTSDPEGASIEITASWIVRGWNFIRFTAAFIGSVFSSINSGYSYAVLVGFVGVGLLLLNGLYLLLHDRDWQSLRIWIPTIGYSLATGLMVALTRLERHEPERVFLTWYTTAAILFWIGLAALMALVIGRIIQEQNRKWLQHSLLYLNLAMVVFFIGRYVVANYHDLKHPFAADIIHPQREDCYMRYIFQQRTDFDPTCVFVSFYLEDVNQMAARRLSLYANRIQESIITDDTDTSIPVLVETHTAWLNVHIRDFFLDGVDRQRIYNVFSILPDNPDVLSTFPDPLELAYDSADQVAINQLLDELGEYETFWHIARSNHETQIPDFWVALTNEGYLQVDAIERNDQMIVSRYQQVPELEGSGLQFGDSIHLRAITPVAAVAEQCDEIQLQTFWRTEGDIELDYSATLTLVNNEGYGVAGSDDKLSIVGTNRWEIDEIYADQRTLTVPCDLPAGEYDLMFAIYYYQAPDDKLTVRGDNDADRDDFVLIQRVKVVVQGSLN